MRAIGIEYMLDSKKRRIIQNQPGLKIFMAF